MQNPRTSIPLKEVIGSFLLFAVMFEGYAAAGEMKLWYEQPAQKWSEALPIGNGRIGAMVFGGIHRERFQLNEESLWAGYPKGRKVSPLEGELLRRKRDLLLEGKYEEAEKLSFGDVKNSWEGPLPESVFVKGLMNNRAVYEVLGNLYLSFPVTEALETEYRRELDLDTAIAKVTFRAGDAEFTREAFCSYPDQVLVIRLTCTKKSSISFSALLERPTDILANNPSWSFAHQRLRSEDSKYAIPVKIDSLGNNGLKMTGQAMGEGVKFEACLKVLAQGGQTSVRSDRIHVENADSVTILLSAVTDFGKKDNWAQLAREQIEQASRKTYEQLKKAHLADYQPLFRRVEIDLGSSFNKTLPLDERLRAVQLDVIDPRGAKGIDRDPDLFALYFQFGRYLLISSSRPGTLPPGLMFWNPSLYPYAFGTYYSDINVEMNYWPAEVTNLSELHTPLFDLTESCVEGARLSAKHSYGTRGLVFHSLTLWGPKTSTGSWQDLGGWLAQHFWEHYMFTQDQEFLKERAYPFMKENALFYLDFMVKDPKTGWLVTGPTYSPENVFYRSSDRKKWSTDRGVTMSLAIIRDLFDHTITAGQILDVDHDLQRQLQQALDQLAPYQVGRYGQLQEWIEDYDEVYPGHRHMSHLFPLHPGHSITLENTPELAQAAKQALLRRLEHGAGWTGWSRAWAVNLAARLDDSKLAHQQITALLQDNTWPNLFNTHVRNGANTSVYQIEGNLGGAAGIAEMLLQSHAGMIELIPALPTQWKNGRMTGLQARGGFEVDIHWSKGKLSKARILSKKGNKCKVEYNGRITEFDTDEGQIYEFDGNLNRI